MQDRQTGQRLARAVAAAMLLCAWLDCSVAHGQASTEGAFVADPNNGCKVWNPHPLPDEIVSWSGACVNGLAQGAGSLQWLKSGRSLEKDDGGWNKGHQIGRGKQEWNSGSYQGELENGEPSGHGVMTLQSARYEGEFRNGKPNGDGTVTNLDGVFKGKWKDGCLTVGKRQITFAVSSATCH
jgi:hypothetical protein